MMSLSRISFSLLSSPFVRRLWKIRTQKNFALKCFCTDRMAWTMFSISSCLPPSDSSFIPSTPRLSLTTVLSPSSFCSSTVSPVFPHLPSSVLFPSHKKDHSIWSSGRWCEPEYRLKFSRRSKGDAAASSSYCRNGNWLYLPQGNEDDGDADDDDDDEAESREVKRTWADSLTRVAKYKTREPKELLFLNFQLNFIFIHSVTDSYTKDVFF